MAEWVVLLECVTCNVRARNVRTALEFRVHRTQAVQPRAVLADLIINFLTHCNFWKIQILFDVCFGLVNSKTIFVLDFFISYHFFCTVSTLVLLYLPFLDVFFTVSELCFYCNSTHYAKTNLKLRIKTEPVTVGANIYCMFSNARHIPFHLLLPWQAWFLCRDSDYFRDSVVKPDLDRYNVQ